MVGVDSVIFNQRLNLGFILYDRNMANYGGLIWWFLSSVVKNRLSSHYLSCQFLWNDFIIKKKKKNMMNTFLRKFNENNLEILVG